jgi:DNA polymerase III delta prime subunit
MKFYESHFEDYLQNTNLHPKLKNIYDKFPSDINKLKNLIFYGPSGIGKYTQVLSAIKKYSPSELKYEKKISINFNKNIYYFKISDIHYEIDMSLLGCQSKLLWNEIFLQIIEIIYITKRNNTGIIVCKYFEKINNELLEIFYSYMQSIPFENLNIKFILITEELSFIPDSILNSCYVIPLERPSKNLYQKNLKNQNFKEKNHKDISQINNIKNIKANINFIEPHKTICHTIINNLINYEEINYIYFRELLYDVFIYNINIFEGIWYILYELVKLKKIKKDNINQIIDKTYRFLQYFNNNYRPIYHLENYLLYLVLEINES